MTEDYHQTVIKYNTGRGFHQSVIFCLNSGMDKKAEIRRQRLASLIGEQFGGNQTAFAEKAGRKQSAISDMLRGAKSFGEKIARDIESKLGLPELWLDGNDEPAGIANATTYISAASPEELAEKLSEKGNEDIMKIIQLLLANKDKISGA